MFSPWIFKKRILGIDVDIEFDFWGSIFKTWQYIYEKRLFYYWSHNMSFKSDSTFPFIKFALKHLPNGSFVIFFFDDYRKIAVQFGRSGPDIHLVTPVWEGNEYEGKRKELSKLIKKSRIEKSAIYRKTYGKNKIDVGINFHGNCTKAANFAVLVTKELFNLQDPMLFEYESHRLVPK
jgi:hypothetical protein